MMLLRSSIPLSSSLPHLIPRYKYFVWALDFRLELNSCDRKWAELPFLNLKMISDCQETEAEDQWSWFLWALHGGTCHYSRKTLHRVWACGVHWAARQVRPVIQRCYYQQRLREQREMFWMSWFGRNFQVAVFWYWYEEYMLRSSVIK